ncbi:MAG: glucans biosynthesis glucosyltransferase MdoH [Alphaproteobacteria bacterium]|nr:glucans biosynthesis glucosyltransferase MdoH [Alphaproteobacteria bacterium]
MSDQTHASGAAAGPTIATPARPLTTPAGLQSTAQLSRRRWLVLGLNVLTTLALLALVALVLASDGWQAVEVVALAAISIAMPWTVLGFWNAVIGVTLLHRPGDVLADVAPYAAAGAEPTPLTIRTAVLMTLRNEDPARALHRLRVVKTSLDATGSGAAFDWFVLSDTNRPDVAAAEEAAIARWREEEPDSATRIHYRRRSENTGFKAGNLRDFCARWGADYELMLPLDADSVMDGPTIVAQVRMMQAHPRLGILQSLVVGMPAQAAFARLFQFGMRHAMRSYTMGQAWWTGDCGPFWGHNALVRIRPFADACHLPMLPGKPPLGGHILSHDQVEATLMRRAGYEVRVLPVEGGSWEENPPSMPDFVQRDLRWCQGNLQYLKLLSLPGLLPMSRFQLVWAIAMFAGIPAWTLVIALLPLLALAAGPAFPAPLAIVLFVLYLGMFLTPKLAGLVDVLLTPGGAARYGGGMRLMAGAAAETLFSFLQSAASTLHTTLFMIGILFGRTVSWGGQARDPRRLAWGEAARLLWPQTLFGTVVVGSLVILAPALALWSLPLTLGYLVAIPFAVVTANPALSAWLVRHGIAAIPEDIAAPAEVQAVAAGPGR